MMKQLGMFALMGLFVASAWAKPDYSAWEIEVKPGKLKQIVVRQASGEPRLYWYFLAELSNRDAAAHPLNLVATILTDDTAEDRAEPLERTSLYRPGRLASRLSADSKDDLSQYLRENLSEKTRTLIDRFNEDSKVTTDLHSALLDDMNRLLKDRDLYKSDRFDAIKLKNRTKKLAGDRPSDALLVRLNRQLLSQAYPDMITLKARPTFIWDQRVFNALQLKENVELYGGTKPLVLEPGSTITVCFLFDHAHPLARHYEIKIDGLINGLEVNRKVRRSYVLEYELKDDEFTYQNKIYSLVNAGWVRRLRARRLSASAE